jgi:energy-coupling factor transport system ATP-binding protein
MMTILALDHVSYSYPNGYKAVENLNLQIQSGESLAIIGQNGAGKTTAVKLMNGLLKPNEGEVRVEDWNTKKYSTAKLSHKVGYIFQNPDDQIFHNTVYREVEFGPKNIRLSPEKVKENVEKAIQLCGLKSFEDENPYNLPYSIRKFVTIASVMAMEPNIIIFDEPTAGQDLIGMVRLGDIIRFLRDEGKTILTITHDMEFVVRNFERVVVMANRQIVADDHVRHIFWNQKILETSMLKQPYISRVANRLEMGNKILSIQEMIDQLKGKRNLHSNQSS